MKIMRQTFFFTILATVLFFSCKPTTDTDKKTGSKTESATDTAPAEPITFCYLLKFGKDINAFQVTVNPDNSAEGYLAWEPFEKDGGRGFFEGKKDGNFLSGDFTYMIEGAIQTEEVVFKIQNDGVSKGRGPLDDSGDRFIIIDKASLNFDDVYASVDCSEISSSVENAKNVTQIIKAGRSNRYESLTGTYNYDLGNDQGAGELLVKQLENDQVKISFNIVMRGPAFNQGSGEGILNLDENLSGIYKDETFAENCEIQFSFKGKKVISKQLIGDFADCGFGYGVIADQEFAKTASEDPFVGE